MLCLMFESSERGVLADSSGVAWTDEEIARAVGGEHTLVLEGLRELVATGVAGRNQFGAVYCRRMVRDEEQRRQNAVRQTRFRNAPSNGPNNAPVTHSLTPLSEDEDEDEDRGKGSPRGKPTEKTGRPSPDCATELLVRVGRIYGRKANGQPVYSELCAASELARRPGWQDELARIESFRRGLKAGDKRYFPQSVSSLLAKWDDVLDRAGTTMGDAPKTALQEAAAKALKDAGVE